MSASYASIAAPFVAGTVRKSRVSPLRLEVTSDLASLEAHWRAFEQTSACTPFQSFDWLNTWYRTVGARSGVRPAIVTGRRGDGSLLFVLPLAIERGSLRRTLTFLGHASCDYNAPLLAPDFLDVIGEGVAGWFANCTRLLQSHADFRHDLVVLDKMPERIGEQRNPMVELSSALHPSGAHSTALTADWESFYAAKSSGDNRRRDRARRRQLDQQGEVRFATIEGSTDRAAALAILFDYKSGSLTRMGAPDIFASESLRSFYREVAARSTVHVSRLDVGDHCAAVNLGVMFRGCYFHILTTFDDELRRFGPGAMHLRELMRYAIEHGCSTFDFTVGDESFKRDWSDTEMHLYDHVSAVGWRGIASSLRLKQWHRLKRTIKQSPRLWALATRLRRVLGTVGGAREAGRPSNTAINRDD